MALDYANERWVRVYTRDTTTWKLLTWQARAVLMFLIRKVDRSGVLDVGEDGIAGLAAVLEIPEEVAADAMAQLERRGVVVTNRDAYVLPAFIEAQETPSSDAQRKRDSREKRRSRVIESQNVTEESQNVTDGHVRSHAVTNGHSETRQDETRREREPDATHPASPPAGFALESPQPPAPRRRASGVTRQAAKHALPEDWQPDSTLEAEARAAGVDLSREIAKLRDWARAEGARKADWTATARNWIRRAGEQSGARPHAPGQAPPRRKFL